MFGIAKVEVSVAVHNLFSKSPPFTNYIAGLGYEEFVTIKSKP
jgi:hypothetical protein